MLEISMTVKVGPLANLLASSEQEHIKGRSVHLELSKNEVNCTC